MKFAIMQPYFFPYVGHFDLIYQADSWIVFDTCQFIQQGWINRNRVLHPKSGWQYIIVPRVRHPSTAPINEIRISEDSQWREKIIAQLQHYKRKAPFFGIVTDLVRACIYDNDTLLSQLNVRTLEKVCDYLAISFRYSIFSEMDLDQGAVDSPTDRALTIAERLGATEYLNPAGGAHLFDRSRFEAAGITLSIQSTVDYVYDCDGYQFQPNMSVIDVLMWNSPGTVRTYLASRSLSSSPHCANEEGSVGEIGTGS